MSRDPRAYLFDIREAADRIARFVSGRSLEEYLEDELLRSAVERQYVIVGEAIVQLARHHPEVAAALSDHKNIIAFRNILIHAYARIDDRIVWNLVHSSLAQLRNEAQALEASLG